VSDLACPAPAPAPVGETYVDFAVFVVIPVALWLLHVGWGGWKSRLENAARLVRFLLAEIRERIEAARQARRPPERRKYRNREIARSVPKLGTPVPDFTSAHFRQQRGPGEQEPGQRAPREAAMVE
jgi:hypothetical protein